MSWRAHRFTPVARALRPMPSAAAARGRAVQRRAQLVRELGLEPAQERLDRAVGTVVQQAAQAQARDVREAAREHLGPGLDRGALRFAEPFQLFLEQPLHAFLRRAPIALLQRAEQRPVVALGEPVLQLVERVVDLLARGPGLDAAARLGFARRAARSRPCRCAGSRASRRPRASTSPRHGHVDDERRLARRRVRREPLERRLVQDRLAGAGRRQQRFDGGRLAAESVERHVLRAVARRERRGLVGAAVHDRELEPGLRERHGRALRHRRHADERDAPRRARDALAQLLHGDLGERHAAFGELRPAAHARRDPQRLLEHESQARPAQAELERAFLAVADLADDLGLADARRVEPRRRQEQVLGGAFALPGAQAPLGFAVRGRAPRQQLERVAAQVLRPACGRCARRSARRDCRSRGTRARRAACGCAKSCSCAAARSCCSANSASASLPPWRHETPTSPMLEQRRIPACVGTGSA